MKETRIFALVALLLTFCLTCFVFAACDFGTPDPGNSGGNGGGNGGGDGGGQQTAQYTVTFNLNYTGATGAPAAQTVNSGGKANKPTDPTRQGYTFGGWFVNTAGTGTAFDFNTAITANTTLYAIWTESGGGQGGGGQGGGGQGGGGQSTTTITVSSITATTKIFGETTSGNSQYGQVGRNGTAEVPTANQGTLIPAAYPTAGTAGVTIYRGGSTFNRKTYPGGNDTSGMWLFIGSDGKFAFEGVSQGGSHYDTAYGTYVRNGNNYTFTFVAATFIVVDGAAPGDYTLPADKANCCSIVSLTANAEGFVVVMAQAGETIQLTRFTPAAA